MQKVAQFVRRQPRGGRCLEVISAPYSPVWHCQQMLHKCPQSTANVREEEHTPGEADTEVMDECAGSRIMGVGSGCRMKLFYTRKLKVLAREDAKLLWPSH